MALAEGYSYCPQCQKWVDVATMRYFSDEVTHGGKVCQACLDGKESVGLYDPLYYVPRCPWCDVKKNHLIENAVVNYGGVEMYHCDNCGEDFRRD